MPRKQKRRGPFRFKERALISSTPGKHDRNQTEIYIAAVARPFNGRHLLALILMAVGRVGPFIEILNRAPRRTAEL